MNMMIMMIVIPMPAPQVLGLADAAHDVLRPRPSWPSYPHLSRGSYTQSPY